MKELICNNKSRILAMLSLILFIFAAIIEATRLYAKGYFVYELLMLALWVVPFVIFYIGLSLNKQRRIDAYAAFSLGGQLGLSVSVAAGTEIVSPSFMRAMFIYSPSTIAYFVLMGLIMIALVFMLKRLITICLAATIALSLSVTAYTMWLYTSLTADVYLFALAYILFLLSAILSIKEHTYECFDCLLSDYYRKYYKDTSNEACRAIIETYACMNIGTDNYEKAAKYLSFFSALEKADFRELYESGLYGKEFVLSFASDISTFAYEHINIEKLSQKTQDFLMFLKTISSDENEADRMMPDLVLLLYDDIRPEYFNEIDISSHSPHPIDLLSNFASHPFVLDGVTINSMEGFLQSLKFRRKSKQKSVCLLTGAEAKKAGKNAVCWRAFKHLYWNGKRINRFSDKYTALINRAYLQMSKENPSFCEALKETADYSLAHSIGKQYKDETVLTETEFINNLNMIRNSLE